MLYQEQHHRQVTRMDQKKRVERTRSAKEEEEVNLEIVDMSGMALKSMPDPSINTRFICKLDLSNNDLQVLCQTSIKFFFSICMCIFTILSCVNIYFFRSIFVCVLCSLLLP